MGLEKISNANPHLYRLYKVRGWSGWGQCFSDILGISDTREELEEYCSTNGYKLSEPWAVYYIVEPEKIIILEEIR